MRKIPSQVPSAVSRLLQGQVISTPPTWFNPVLSHPPPQLPPYQVKSRPRASDSGIKSGDFIDTVPIPAGELERRDKLRGYKQRKGRPLEIAYEEDRVRRQFFKDFPFEALRPVSMVEGREIDVRGKVLGEEWVRLEQRGSYPTVEEALETLQSSFSSTTTSTSSSGAAGSSSRVKYREQPRWQWSNTVPPSSIPPTIGGFSAGQDYMSKWKMPEPLRVGSGNGDLLGVIPRGEEAATEATEATVEGMVEEDAKLEDLEILKAALGSSKSSSV
ncbi:hypothetical protein I307_01125 [Cryptococcus deuterogattii 99/473]|uniref:Small ribosomal subunit protein mS23 n=1 Tax=Cryptococcus deuterogattii Ram5 TaxID=1296110 RepID=A0A0D0VD29_9TREE|nr:hypothetical protein I313_00978 [Cryptococcus deuterogattii Ram5]KIY59456.1 hypothetical protein I307_01125 [Cryptococcus deuterogattii 99/473]